VTRGNALSAFRAQALLPRLKAACPRIAGIAARHVHWVWTDAKPDAAQVERLHGAYLAAAGVYAGGGRRAQ